MAFSTYQDYDFISANRINNLPDAVLPQQPATLAQLAAVMAGLAWKDNVRPAAQSNVTLSAPGATIDGLAMAANDRVLLRNQSTAIENGIYVWNGAAVAMTRSADANTGTGLTSAVVSVDAGTDAGTRWRQTTLNPALGTSTIVWVADGSTAPPATTTTAGLARIATQSEVDAGTASPVNMFVSPATLAAWASRFRGFAADIGDGTATTFTVTHNLGTRDVDVQVRRNSGAFDYVGVDIGATTINTVTVTFAGIVPAANAFRALVSKAA